MSMFIVGKTHIDLLITAALSWECAVPERANEIGRMLWNENLGSAKYRYPDCRDGNWPASTDFKASDVETYTFEPVPGPIDPQVIGSACSCYTYQSCEHPGWDNSQAHTWVRVLRATATMKLPEYEQRFGVMTQDAVRRLYRQSGEQHDWLLIQSIGEPPRVSCMAGWDSDRDVLTRIAAQRAQATEVPA